MRSRTETMAMIMPNPQGSTAAPGCTLINIASRLVTKHSSHGIGALPKSDSRKGRKNNSSHAADITRLIHDAGSEAADIDGARTRAAAVLGQALAAIGGGAAVIAVMAAHIVPVAGRRVRAFLYNAQVTDTLVAFALPD